MKTILLIAASGVTVGGLYAGGVFDRGKVYDLPIAEARARLEMVQIPRMAALTAAGSDQSAMRFSSAEDSVRWSLAGRGGGSFEAILAPAGPGRTRVTLNYEPASVDKSFGDQLRSTRFMRGFVETSFAEEVDARLEGRVADQAQAMRDFAREVASDPEAVRELGLVTEEMFRSVNAEINATVHAPSGPSAGQRMSDATKPMIQLPAN